MSIWTDIQKRSNGDTVRKEEGVLRKIKDQEDIYKRMFENIPTISIDKFTAQISSIRDERLQETRKQMMDNKKELESLKKELKRLDGSIKQCKLRIL